MKSQIRNVTHGEWEYQALAFWCPGCEHPGDDDQMQGGLHMLAVSGHAPGPRWDFDGNLEAPTLSPSILTRTEHSRRRVDGELRDVGLFVCHSFLVAGVFQFLGDCTHPLANQHVPMPELPEWATR